MSGITPKFDEWRQLSAIAIRDVAILMLGFDPRAVALGDVVVRDPEDPSNPNGVTPDSSWNERVLISAVLSHHLVSVPGNVTDPSPDTEVSTASLLAWFRSRGRVDLADGLADSGDLLVHASTDLSHHRQSVVDGVSTAARAPALGEQNLTTSACTDFERAVSAESSVTRKRLIQMYKPEWLTIERDLSDAAANGLSHAAKANRRGWLPLRAREWALGKGKFLESKNAGPLNAAMSALRGRVHRIND